MRLRAATVFSPNAVATRVGYNARRMSKPLPAHSQARERQHNRIAPLLLRCDKHPLVGEAAAVAARVLRQPELLDELIECLFNDDAGQRARATSALAAVAARRIEWLQPHKATLFELLAELEQ